jgi:hypothetical protein
MKINIDNPDRLVTFVGKSLTSWNIQYIGRAIPCDTYYYILTDKENDNIKITVEIPSETERMVDPADFVTNQYVKINCKNQRVTPNKEYTKFIKVEHFKDVRRVFNEIHSGGREVK